MASVEERVIDIVAEQLGVSKDQITRETSFVNDLGADSLDTVELVMELEEEFDINIPDDAAEKIQTVGQAIEHIEKAVARQRNLLFLTGFHETTCCRYGHGRGHLAQLPSRRSLDSPLRRRERHPSAYTVRYVAASRALRRRSLAIGPRTAISTPREAKRLDRFTQFALVAGIDAVRDSGIDFAREDPFRCGVILGSGIGGLRRDRSPAHPACWKKAPTRSRPSPFPS